MDVHAGATVVHYVEHGRGLPVVILHGAGVDHREPEACFEPIFAGAGGCRRIYPDLPGMGRTAATTEIRSAQDILEVLGAFVRSIIGKRRYLLMGHSAGAYFAQALTAREPRQIAGLFLVCPLLQEARDIPEHRVAVESGEIGDEEFRSYFVIHTPEMLARYERYVAPGAALADQAALARIGQRWELSPAMPLTYGGPTLILAGRHDSTAGYAAAVDLAEHYPSASIAVLDAAGHALPHEQPDLMRALTIEWLARVDRATSSGSAVPGTNDV